VLHLVFMFSHWNPMKYTRRAVQWRREKAWELKSMGFTTAKIAEKLNTVEVRISPETIKRDLRIKQ